MFAAQLGLPRTTVRRWQGEARAQLRDIFTEADRAALADIGRQVAAVFPGLLQQNGPKKEKGEAPMAKHKSNSVIEPIERPAEWEAHRTAVLGSLAPAPGIEMVLAERIASLLWRQQRIVRWEANPLQKDQQCVELDLMQEDLIRGARELRVTKAVTLVTMQEDVDWRRRTVKALQRLRELADDQPLTADDIGPIMIALERTATIDVSRKKIKLPGLPEDVMGEDGYEEWDGYTVGLVRSWAALLAKKARRLNGAELIESAYQSQFVDLMRAENDVRELEVRIAWERRSRDKLPLNAERLAQHEAHLSREVSTALAQLAALQDRRRRHVDGTIPLTQPLALPMVDLEMQIVSLASAREPRLP